MKRFITIVMIFHLIISQDNICFESCQSCTSKGNGDSHQCNICNNGLFLIENTQNCFMIMKFRIFI